ncbi:MAG: L-2-amino-thiazoline-4-carboxylic acid hydrolase [Planctomycetota bacterium]|jgi:hypothetical protein
MDVPAEERFKVLCEITRAQHFAWREAALALAPQLDPQELSRKMWEITGAQTARAYLKRLDTEKPLAPQVARCIAWSSTCMGEEITVEKGDGDEAFLRHTDCPWFHWHKRLDLLQEDQPGCDTWFFTVVAEINRALGTNIRIETTSSLPEGGDCCLRRIWVEQPAATRAEKDDQ